MSENLPPTAPIDYESLPVDSVDRHAQLVEGFGQWLFWLRNRSINEAAEFVESEDAREKLGNIRRKPYEAAISMPPEQRQAALRFARATLDSFLERFLWALGDEGVDCRFDAQHAYRFRIQMEIVDVSAGVIIEDQPVNRGGQFFGKNWGRWLNRYGSTRT